MFEPFHEIVRNVYGTLKKYEQQLDRPIIGVMPAYFPMELIDAVGGYPVQLWGNNLRPEKSDAHLQSFCCSVARSMLELELSGKAKLVKAYAFTSLCDSLTNLREIYKRIIPKPTVELSIPMTQTREARQIYLQSVLGKVIKGLEKVTGNSMTEASLREAVSVHGRARELQRKLYALRRNTPGLITNFDFYTVIKAGFFLPRVVYIRMLEELLQTLSHLEGPAKKGVRLITTGLVFDPIIIHQLLDEMGIQIVDDDFANGWRTVSKEEIKADDLVEGVTDFLFNPAPCCCLYNPDNDRHAYLVDKVNSAQADGVLFWYMNFCEPDAFDKPQLTDRLKQEEIPTAFIDVELTMANFDAIKTRINAFCEMLEEMKK